MESRKNGESAVEKKPLAAAMKKGASKAPSGSGDGGAAMAVDPAAAAAMAEADREAWDRFIERRYSIIG